MCRVRSFDQTVNKPLRPPMLSIRVTESQGIASHGLAPSELAVCFNQGLSPCVLRYGRTIRRKLVACRIPRMCSSFLMWTTRSMRRTRDSPARSGGSLGAYRRLRSSRAKLPCNFLSRSLRVAKCLSSSRKGSGFSIRLRALFSSCDISRDCPPSRFEPSTLSVCSARMYAQAWVSASARTAARAASRPELSRSSRPPISMSMTPRAVSCLVCEARVFFARNLSPRASCRRECAALQRDRVAFSGCMCCF